MLEFGTGTALIIILPGIALLSYVGAVSYYGCFGRVALALMVAAGTALMLAGKSTGPLIAGVLLLFVSCIVNLLRMKAPDL